MQVFQSVKINVINTTATTTYLLTSRVVLKILPFKMCRCLMCFNLFKILYAKIVGINKNIGF